MSEPIIIETPAPPTRERLVLVPTWAVSVDLNGGELTIATTSARDATPDDLARGGYVASVGDGSFAAVCDVIQRAEKAEGLLIQRETELRLAREDGVVSERGRHAAIFKANKHRDEWNLVVTRAQKAERERDEAKEFARVLEVERDTLRAELARLTAPVEGEPTGEELARAERVAEGTPSWSRRNIYRLGVAHERARQQPAKDRATDEELFAAYQRAFVLASDREDGIEGDPDPERLKVEHVTDVERAAVRAVAARVWQERCLVAQAVAMGVSLEIGPHSKGVDIHVSRPRENADGGEFFEGELVEAGRDDVPPSEASATLARLLGEVGRG